MKQELIDKYGLVAEYDMDSFIGYRLGADIYIKQNFITCKITAIKGQQWIMFDSKLMELMDKETALKIIESMFKATHDRRTTH